MPAVAEKTTEKPCCKYCGEEIKLRPQDRNITRITCGSMSCLMDFATLPPQSLSPEVPPTACPRAASAAPGRPKACGRAHINGTPSAPVKGSAATEVQGEGVQQAPPAAGLDRPSVDVRHPAPASGEHMAGPLGVSCCDLTDSCAECPNNPEQPAQPIYRASSTDRICNGDPILAAVLALEAVPREKWNAIMDVLAARHEAKLAASRAEGLLQALGVA